jgi:MFS transporter, SP family, sugar:H+ symporter
MVETAGTQEQYNTVRAVHLAAVAALGGFLFGYDTAVINGAVVALRGDFEMSAGVTGFVVASALLGAALGAWGAGRVADRFGRIRVMFGAAVLFIVSAIGSGLALGPIDLTIWRVIGGVAVGAASVIAPAYIAEISPAPIRGRLGSLQQLAIVTGIFISLLVDALLANLAGGAAEDLALGLQAWRWMFIAEALPGLVYLVMCLTIPESPRYLVAQGEPKEARRALSRVLTAGVDDRISEIQRTVRAEERRKARFADLRGHVLGLKPIVWVGILLSVFQQAVGINVIFYYSTALWQQVGFSESDALTITVITSVTNIVVTLVAIATIDRVGRRILLLVGSAGMALSLGTLAWMFGTAPVVDGEPVLGDTAGIVALVAANLFVVFFGVSWGPVVWVLLGEMFNNRIRAGALGLAASAQWISNFVISQTFPVLAGIALSLAYGLYTAFAVLSFFFVAKFVRETKGRQLEDME